MRVKRTQVRLTLDAELVKEARRVGINLSRLCEEHLRTVVREERQRRWLEENREAFAVANRFIKKYGIFNAEDRER